MARGVREVSPASRKFNLLMALLTSERGYTKHELFTGIDGYRQLVDASGANASLEKMFERDKQELRDRGWRIETLEDPARPGDNRFLRYRIPEGAQSMPHGLHFSAEECALIEAAYAALRSSDFADSAARGLAKIRATEATAALPSGDAPRLRARSTHFDRLSEAIASRREITFVYRKVDASQLEERHARPLALVAVDGVWMLIADDRDRKALRRFVVSRISGTIRLGDSYPDEYPSQREVTESTLAEFSELRAEQRARILVEEGSDAEVRLTRRSSSRESEHTGWNELELGYLDRWLLADELAGFGPEVIVLEPAELRADVTERLERVRALHAEVSA
ncbi:WYL domain-containing protein [Pseudoclavibacter alba]|uniref:WYL domain-containing protein n=1 Tax=Pseudoclavibacter albus TaxID=272241 RepID=UPI0019D25BBC|nr:WYL domain-containing protein [Pseudoclavibacter alba]